MACWASGVALESIKIAPASVRLGLPGFWLSREAIDPLVFERGRYRVGMVTVAPGTAPGTPRADVGGVAIRVGVTVIRFPGFPGGGVAPTTALPPVYGIVAVGAGDGDEGGGDAGNGLARGVGARFGVGRNVVSTPSEGGGAGLTAELPTAGRVYPCAPALTGSPARAMMAQACTANMRGMVILPLRKAGRYHLRRPVQPPIDLPG